jgi:hypothetical protein
MVFYFIFIVCFWIKWKTEDKNKIPHLVAIPYSNLLIPVDTRTRHTNPNSFRHIQTSKDCYKYSYFPRSITTSTQWLLISPLLHSVCWSLHFYTVFADLSTSTQCLLISPLLQCLLISPLLHSVCWSLHFYTVFADLSEYENVFSNFIP